MVWLTILGFLIVAVYYVTLRRKGKKLTSSSHVFADPSGVMSTEEARIMVDELVARRDHLIAAPSTPRDGNLDQFGPITREFFAKYGVLRTRNGGFQLSLADVKQSEYMSGFISIGHSEDWDVIQKPGADEVFVVEGAETREADIDVRFPSVYHLVLDEVESKKV